MRFLTWSFALVALLVWSMVAWLLFSLSDWLAALAGGLLSGVFSTEIDPWVKWLTASLGNIIQGAVVVLWFVVGLAILALPAWFNRKRRREQMREPTSFLGGRVFRPDGKKWTRPTRGELREEWSKTRSYAVDDFDKLKHVAGDFIRQHVKGRKPKDWGRKDKGWRRDDD
ncbi:MAG TPA: hypothetical protein PK970_01315 [Hyphomicrobiaceae bacterium]|nr:hypothetical protein [Hyphomicrobiaceae bacterium]